MADYDYNINHPTTPDELLRTLEFYRAPMHLQFFQIKKYNEYVAEYGDPPESYMNEIVRLVNNEQGAGGSR